MKPYHENQPKYKSTYESVKNDPMYETVKEYWEFMGYSISDISIQETQRKFNLGAVTVLKYKYALQYEAREIEL
jgi:hypothetical protein